MSKKLRIVLASALICGLQSHAHHSITAHYDPGNIQAITGTLDSVQWQNPHTIFYFTQTTEQGETRQWHVEAGAINTIRRVGVQPDTIQPGDEVTMIGALHRREPGRMVAAGLIHNGTEYPIFGPIAKALSNNFDEQAGFTTSASAYRVDAQAAPDLFRVWSPTVFPATAIFELDLPLLPEARAAFEAYDEATGDLAVQCQKPGMPSMLDNPYPMEMVDMGDHIRMRLEEWEAERRIYMNGSLPADHPTTRYGDSLGRWEDGVLVIETRNIDYPYFDDAGVPMSDAMVVTERYELNEDGTRLDWTATMNDPKVMTAPVSYGGTMVWSPGIEIQEYKCEPE
jgi:hypothetical protein